MSKTDWSDAEWLACLLLRIVIGWICWDPLCFFSQCRCKKGRWNCWFAIVPSSLFVSSGGFSFRCSLVQAASLLEKAGINPQAVMAAANAAAMVGPGGSKMERVNYCNIVLPLPQPLVPDDSPIVQRLFIVCQPSAVSERVLRDAFSRFGNLIDVFLLSGKETARFHYPLWNKYGRTAAWTMMYCLCSWIVCFYQIQCPEKQEKKGVWVDLSHQN